MLVEIRHYTIKPGLRDEFVAWFEDQVVPAMTEAGMRILGVFTGMEDPDAFFYLRAFEDMAERERLTQEFYGGVVWLDTMRDKALAMESSYEVHLVESTSRSSI